MRINKNRNKIIVVGLCLAVLATGVYFALSRNNTDTTSSKYKDPFGKTITGPTDTEKDETKAIQKQQEQASEERAQEASGKKDATVTITNASQIDREVTVSAFIGNIFENEGTCTAVFTKGNLTFSKASKGFVNATTTNCTPIRADRSEFADSGDWQVVVRYSSNAASGVSKVSTISIK